MSKVQVTQQRVFIGDMQRFNTVEITPNTNAGDVVALIASQGSLDHTAVWMLFELANDFGMGKQLSHLLWTSNNSCNYRTPYPKLRATIRCHCFLEQRQTFECLCGQTHLPGALLEPLSKFLICYHPGPIELAA
jgi:hypothetical protein